MSEDQTPNADDSHLGPRMLALLDQGWAALRDRLYDVERISVRGAKSQDDSDLARACCAIVAVEIRRRNGEGS